MLILLLEILSAYLYKKTKDKNLLLQHVTLIKYNVQIKNQPYQTIINSDAIVSMIAYSIVKEFRLKFEYASTSLIVSAVRTFTWPFGIIKDLSIEIEDARISITVEVVLATSYLLLLGNNLSKKIKANYN